MYKGVDIGLTESAIITVFSMGIVFVALLSISYIIDLMRIVYDKKDTNKKESNKQATTATQPAVNSAEGNDDEITAVISAVVASMEEETETVAAITAAVAMILGKDASEFIVKNIKRSPELDPSWAQTGRMKLMR